MGLGQAIRDAALRTTGDANGQMTFNTLTPEQWRGLLPQNQMPMPQVAPQPFMALGPYGRQASQMAGLLSPQQDPRLQSTGLLGGPPRAFRIPYPYGK